MSDKGVLLSIILTYYRSQDYLAACLSSILPQLNEQTELIIVNDGSTDDSQNIVEMFIADCHLATNINHFEISNKGVALARNKALSVAKGSYIGFMDSDDVVKNNYVDRLSGVLSKHTPDLVSLDYQDFSSSLNFTVSKVANEDFVSHLSQSRYDEFKRFEWQPWRFIFKKSLIADDFFTDLKVFSDSASIPSMFLKDLRLVEIHEKLYGYRVGVADSLSNEFKPQHFYSWQHIKNSLDINPSYDFACQAKYWLQVSGNLSLCAYEMDRSVMSTSSGTMAICKLLFSGHNRNYRNDVTSDAPLLTKRSLLSSLSLYRLLSIENVLFLISPKTHYLQWRIRRYISRLRGRS